MFKLAASIAVLTFAAGCVTHYQHASHPPPPPAPPPRPVVVTPPPAPQPRPVVVTPRPAPQPPPVVVVTPPPDRPAHLPPVTSPPAKEPWINVSITTQERQVIREHAVVHSDSGQPGKKGKGKSLPPGLAKKEARGGELPPGWQKKCVRGQIMPGEVYRHCQPLPQEVVAKLPPPPPGTVLVTVEGKVVRLARATLEILDVFDVL